MQQMQLYNVLGPDSRDSSQGRLQISTFVYFVVRHDACVTILNVVVGHSAREHTTTLPAQYCRGVKRATTGTDTRNNVIGFETVRALRGSAALYIALGQFHSMHMMTSAVLHVTAECSRQASAWRYMHLSLVGSCASGTSTAD